MRLGLFYQLPCTDSHSEPTRYQETLEQISVADELGFDCAWLAELHFLSRSP
jgi:alkanesulfonate monooxygenase SsuD/methylene tetrahydromethanopterin reductase-like flavin-dependent oxidoreductase (luciferase family)